MATGDKERMAETFRRAWAIVARHPELEQALTAIGQLLHEAYGVVGLRIDWPDEQHGRWASIAAVGAAQRIDCVAQVSDIQRLLRQPLTSSVNIDELDDVVRRAMSASVADSGSEWAAGVLGSHALTPTLAIVYIPTANKPAFVSVAADWWDLLGVAVDNDRRLTELRMLREAAEADRRALLQRLGREAVRTGIIGETGGLKPVFERVDIAAPSDMSVLLLGATGSGKEVVARAVHDRSPRADKPFIRVNCGAIPSELIDSELFGHEKGSFTGAATMRRGWFERADGGTLFLDEVAELPAAAQVRLLRVLQEKRFNRVGGEREIAVDVRVVAATHRDLEHRMAEERFREDLWYRLAGFPIRIPSLADRVGDIPELARHFVARSAARLGLPPVMPNPQQIRVLQRYAWPGNVRELISVIERAVVLGQGRTLDLDAALGVAARFVPSPGGRAPEVAETPDRLDDVLAAHIRRTLERTGGRIAGPHGAARLLDVHPNTLRSRMNRLGLKPARQRQSRSEYE